jgi:hypothetical protein
MRYALAPIHAAVPTASLPAQQASAQAGPPAYGAEAGRGRRQAGSTVVSPQVNIDRTLLFRDGGKGTH